jgi:hypothetical protein
VGKWRAVVFDVDDTLFPRARPRVERLSGPPRSGRGRASGPRRTTPSARWRTCSGPGCAATPSRAGSRRAACQGKQRGRWWRPAAGTSHRPALRRNARAAGAAGRNGAAGAGERRVACGASREAACPRPGAAAARGGLLGRAGARVLEASGVPFRRLLAALRASGFAVASLFCVASRTEAGAGDDVRGGREAREPRHFSGGGNGSALPVGDARGAGRASSSNLN